VKNATEYAKRLAALLKQVGKAVSAPDEVPEREPLFQLIHAFLAWETSRNQADQAYTRLMTTVVDVNELRVSDPMEVIDAIGPKYVRAEERAHRLCRALHGVYNREHVVDLSSLKDKNKRDAKDYLESLEGIVPFVVASVMLLSLDSHAIPVDEQLVDRLKRDEVVDPDATLEDVQSFLEHQIRADDGLEAFFGLRAYVERPIKVSLGPAKLPKSSGKPKTKKSTKKSKKSTKSASTKKKTTKRTTKSSKKSTKSSKKSSKKKTTKRRKSTAGK